MLLLQCLSFVHPMRRFLHGSLIDISCKNDCAFFNASNHICGSTIQFHLFLYVEMILGVDGIGKT
jgi:hypothetical protein